MLSPFRVNAEKLSSNSSQYQKRFIVAALLKPEIGRVLFSGSIRI